MGGRASSTSTGTCSASSTPTFASPRARSRRSLGELERDERLGLAGSYLQESGARIRIGEGHVHGATKFFRRDCWEEISPVPPILGWDTIDEFTARMRGWRTQSFAMPDGDPEHLRPRGTHDGLLRGYRRWGECSYALGESPLHVALYTLRQMATERPPRRGRRELRGRLRRRGAPARAAGRARRARLGAARAKAEDQGRESCASPKPVTPVSAAWLSDAVLHTNVQGFDPRNGPRAA